jgi:hypothetical protein
MEREKAFVSPGLFSPGLLADVVAGAVRAPGGANYGGSETGEEVSLQTG